MFWFNYCTFEQILKNLYSLKGRRAEDDFLREGRLIGPARCSHRTYSQRAEVLLIYKAINLRLYHKIWTDKLQSNASINMYLKSRMFASPLSIHINHGAPYAELQTETSIIASSQEITQGASCDWLLKCTPVAVGGFWAHKVAVTVGQNASSGPNLLNELTCSCWQH